MFILLDVALAISANEQPFKTNTNRPRSIYQYSNMALRLSGQTAMFGGVFLVFESLLGIERQKKLKKPRSHVRILIYRTWPNTEMRVMFVGVTFL